MAYWSVACLLWLAGSVPPGIALAGAPTESPSAPQQNGASAQARQNARQPANEKEQQEVVLPDRFDIRIVSPEPSDPIFGRVSIAAEVETERPSAIRSVDFFVDGRMLFSDVEAPYELLWDPGRSPSHRIEVVAYGPGRLMVSDAVETGAVLRDLADRRTFAARVDRVEVYVRLEGDAELEFAADDFEVLEEGQLQPIVDIERVASLPVAIGMLIDHSGSMVDVLEDALEAGSEFIDSFLTHPNDKALALAFSDVPVVLQGFTNDTGRLHDALSLIKRGRYTSLYDAIVAAAAKFEGIEGRRAAVLLTDGGDSRSETAFKEAIEAAQRADLVLYPIALDLSPRFIRERWILNELAETTGGRAFFLGSRDDPEEVFQDIAEDLRAQYRITYAPLVPGGSGEWRELEVRMTDERAAHLQLRARSGYYAR